MTNELNNEKNKNEVFQRNNKGLQDSVDKNEIIKLYKKIDNLNEKLKRYPIILEANEEIISIYFASSYLTIHYSMNCKNTDTISDLEKQLYKEYPAFTESDNFFLCKGTVINKFKTFESYNIKNGDVLTIYKKE